MGVGKKCKFIEIIIVSEKMILSNYYSIFNSLGQNEMVNACNNIENLNHRH